MENSPFSSTPENDNDKDSSGKKKKSAEALGAFIVEPKAEQPKTEKPESILSKLASIESKPEEAAEKDQEQATAEEADVFDPEHEAPLEALSDDETQFVEAELVKAERSEVREAPADDIAAAAEVAVERFRDKIEEGADSEQALTETLAELGDEKGVTEPEVIDLPDDDEAEAVVDLRSAPPAGPLLPPFIPLGGRPTAPNVAPTAAGTTEFVPVPDRSREAGAFILVGIVGYLIGRRRGRIKTEKRLVPVQKKLEKQVVSLKEQLERKETVVREAAVRQARAKGPETIIRKLAVERPVVTERLENRRQVAKAVPLERIGHVLVSAETVTKPQRLEGLNEKDISTLNRAELLAISEKIIVESTSLRQIYENRLVGEKGLRRLVVEFLRGGNVQKALKREIVEHEIDFERDPILRDRAKDGRQAGGRQETNHLEALLKRVDTLPGGDSAEMAVLKSRAAHEAKQNAKRQQRQQAVDATIIATITILIAAIIILLVKR